MSRLTPEILAGFPEEMQKEILENIPVQHLNKVKVVTELDSDPEVVGRRITDLLTGLTRKEALGTIMELARVYISMSAPDDLPVDLQMAGQVELLDSVVEHVRELLKDEGENNDG